LDYDIPTTRNIFDHFVIDRDSNVGVAGGKNSDERKGHHQN
jgi:hypothetical protein